MTTKANMTITVAQKYFQPNGVTTDITKRLDGTLVNEAGKVIGRVTVLLADTTGFDTFDKGDELAITFDGPDPAPEPTTVNAPVPTVTASPIATTTEPVVTEPVVETAAEPTPTPILTPAPVPVAPPVASKAALKP